ncbi:MAG: hypothetical protein IKU31_09165, partial [Oscillospiraceae bacterium]|nr:hypothetical protein [Oscillospiraceae bacterium]
MFFAAGIWKFMQNHPFPALHKFHSLRTPLHPPPTIPPFRGNGGGPEGSGSRLLLIFIHYSTNIINCNRNRIEISGKICYPVPGDFYEERTN